MADSRLNKTGLSYFWSRIKTIFATKTELDALSNRVDDIVSEGGEPNVINSISVNGTTQTVTNKNVDITVPTDTSDLTNDGDGTSPFATQAYVGTNGGKIDIIKVNGTAQTITDKSVNIAVPTKTSDITNDSNFVADASYVHTDNNYTAAEKSKLSGIASGAEANVQADWNVTSSSSDAFIKNKPSIPSKVSDLTNDSGFQTSSEVSSAISTAISGITSFDYQVVTSLPATGTKGVVYLVSNGGSGTNIYDEYIWVTSTSKFEKIGTTDVDLTGYWNETNLTAITTAEIDTIVAS